MIFVSGGRRGARRRARDGVDARASETRGKALLEGERETDGRTVRDDAGASVDGFDRQLVVQ